MDEDTCGRFLFRAGHHARARADGHVHKGQAATRIRKSYFEDDPGFVSAGAAAVSEIPENDAASEPRIPCADVPADVQTGQPIHAAAL